LVSSEKKALTWVTPEERQEKNCKSLSLRKREKEKRSERRKKLPDLKDSNINSAPSRFS